MKRPIKPLYLIEKWIFAAPPIPAAETPLNLVEVHHNHNPPIWQLAVIGVVAVSVAESEKGKLSGQQDFCRKHFPHKGRKLCQFSTFIEGTIRT